MLRRQRHHVPGAVFQFLDDAGTPVSELRTLLADLQAALREA